MNNKYSQLDWISDQQLALNEVLHTWAEINSGTSNLPGLALMLDCLEDHFSTLEGDMTRIPLPSISTLNEQGHQQDRSLGQALHIVKRPQARFKIFLGGHMDTVYDANHIFQKVERLGSNQLRGPGVADMKGGLLVMLTALKAFERDPLSKNLGWEIFINPDEEIGSIGSYTFLNQCAKRNQLGLLFEPSFPDGFLVGARKGSINLTVVTRGRSAHVGRDFHQGRNAIVALARFISACELHFKDYPKMTLNFGVVRGGTAPNVVPDFAQCQLNVRMESQEQFENIEKEITHIAQTLQEDGISFEIHLTSKRPPKPFDVDTTTIFEQLKACAAEEGIQLQQRPTGGVCDGNILANAGLPTIDTLGVIGGNIHTDQEYVWLDSMVSRSRLVYRYLIELAKEHGNER